MPLTRAYIALGSNLGDRLGLMQAALEALAGDTVSILQVSPVYENRAIGMGEAEPFLNSLAEIETPLAPLDLLDRCLAVEAQLGRVRTAVWAPRSIDLDLIVHGDAVIAHERLRLPHPRLAERDFVLHPLNAIAPELRIGGQRVADLAAELPLDALKLIQDTLKIP